MDRAYVESFWFFCPAFADELIRREAFECLQTTTIIIGVDEVFEVTCQLLVIVIMEPFNSCLLDCPVHPLDLAVGPGMLRFCQTVLNPVFPAPHIEHVGHVGGGRAILIAWRICKLDPIVRENCMDFIGHGFDNRDEKGGSRLSVGFIDKLAEGEFTGPVNGDIQMQLAFRGPHLSDINMEVANWIRLEFLFVRLVTRHLWQTGYAMALKAAVQ